MVRGEWAACTDVWLSSFWCASLGISNGVLPAPPGRALPAVVALKPGRSVTAEELLQVCRASRLSSIKQPERVEIIESMPRNTIGKIDKKAVRERYGEGRRKSEARAGRPASLARHVNPFAGGALRARHERLAMDRRDVVMALGAATLPFVTRAQTASPVRRIAVLMSAGETPSKPYVEGLLDGLRDKGWQVGRNLQIEYRWSGGEPARARGLATELVAMAPELILSSGTVSLVALREVQAKLPIVFVNITDPVAGGFVSSLAHPGGNLTGFTPFQYDICGKWLQLLKDTVPSLAHATLLGDPANHNFAGFLRSFTAAARSMHVVPVAAPISSLADIERAIEAEGKAPHGGLILSAAAFVNVYSGQIIALASKHRLPAIYWTVDPVRAGGLMSYAPDFRRLHRASAAYVDRILKVTKPDDLPVQAPDEIDLVINLKTASALGITIPRTMLLQATEVIR